MTVQRLDERTAFVADVPILLMDEPFGALDAQTKLVLQEELLRIWREDQKVVVYVTQTRRPGSGAAARRRSSSHPPVPWAAP